MDFNVSNGCPMGIGQSYLGVFFKNVESCMKGLIYTLTLHRYILCDYAAKTTFFTRPFLIELK